MANFLSAQQYVLKNEGGWCNVAGDSGGETYRGIARNYNGNWGGWQPIDNWKAGNGTPRYNQIFTEDQIPGLAALVNSFYQTTQWNKILGDQINDQAVATSLYDFFVNAGGNAAKCMQRVVGATPDGQIGPNTIGKINSYQGDLLKALNDARIAYYQGLADNNASYQKFLAGWLNRTNALYTSLTASDGSETA